jgi:D-alanine-D-alanine ligase
MSSCTQTQRPRKIALLKGGWSGEREVSLASAPGCSKALKACGFEVLEIDVTQDIAALIATLKAFNPDVVFMNALHGRFVEDGALQSVIEILGYPYTGSGILASAMAMDKAVSRTLFEACGIPIPKGFKRRCAEIFQATLPPLPYPFVLKPVNDGSSLRVFIIKNELDLQRAKEHWDMGEYALVEEYIPGRELSVGLRGDEAWGVLELKYDREFFDYEAKYKEGASSHIVPAELPVDDYAWAMEYGQRAVKALGVEGVSRVDMRYDEARAPGQRLYILEINTLPGMTPLSQVPDIALHQGCSYQELCEWMVLNPIYPATLQNGKSICKIDAQPLPKEESEATLKRQAPF